AQVAAVDADEVTAAIGAFNLRHVPDAAVEHARAQDVDLAGFAALWFDPARRPIGKADRRGSTTRPSDPGGFSPSLSCAIARPEARPRTHSRGRRSTVGLPQR